MIDMAAEQKPKIKNSARCEIMECHGWDPDIFNGCKRFEDVTGCGVYEAWAKRRTGSAGQGELKSEPGKKFDAGKLRYDLFPGDALDDVVQIFTDGAENYGERNWEKGMSWSRPFGAAMRHLWAFWRGEDLDPDSGRPHIAHAIVNGFFLLAYWKRGIGEDTRS